MFLNFTDKQLMNKKRKLEGLVNKLCVERFTLVRTLPLKDTCTTFESAAAKYINIAESQRTLCLHF